MILEQIIKETCACFSDNPKRMIDILWSVQNQLGWISTESIELIAKQTEAKQLDIESVANFYSFFHQKKQGKFVIHLCDDIIDRHAGMIGIEATILSLAKRQLMASFRFTIHLVLACPIKHLPR